MPFEDPRWPDAYVGVPFKSRGRDRNGWDCWGLVREVYGVEEGIELPSYHEQYASALDSHAEILELFIREHLDWLEVRGQPRPGDVAWCRVAGHERHVGIVVRPGLMLHAIEGHDTAIVRYGSSLSPIQVCSYWRHRKLWTS